MKFDHSEDKEALGCDITPPFLATASIRDVIAKVARRFSFLLHDAVVTTW
jgi:hypothetical protein